MLARAAEPPDRVLVAARDPPLERVHLEEVPVDRGGVTAPQRDLRPDAQEDHDRGIGRLAVDLRDPAHVAELRALVGERGHREPVADDVDAVGELRRDLGVEVVLPVRREEQRERPGAEGPLPAAPAPDAPLQDLADERADRSARRLRRHVGLAPLAAEPRAEQLRLRGRARAVEPLEHDEAAGGRARPEPARRGARGGALRARPHGSSPSFERSSR